MSEEWWQIKVEEQREQFALEIISLRKTLIEIREHFNRIEEYKKYFFKDDQVVHILKTWEPYLKDIFEVSDKYKGLVNAKEKERTSESSSAQKVLS